jgi:ribosome-binding factor A
VAGAGHRHRSGGGRRAGDWTARRYPRSARINEVLREVLAESLERLSDTDERLGLLTVTGVDCDPDLRHALVFFASLDAQGEAALGAARVRLQAAISREVRLKRTPQLRFGPDPAVVAGSRIEDILRDLPRAVPDRGSTADAESAAPEPGPSAGPREPGPSVGRWKPGPSAGAAGPSAGAAGPLSAAGAADWAEPRPPQASPREPAP